MIKFRLDGMTKICRGLKRGANMWAKNIMLGKTSAIRSGALLSIGAKNWGVEPRAANGANTGVLECLLGSRDLGQLDAPDEVGLALNTPVATLSTIAGKAAELVLSQGRRVVKNGETGLVSGLIRRPHGTDLSVSHGDLVEVAKARKDRGVGAGRNGGSDGSHRGVSGRGRRRRSQRRGENGRGARSGRTLGALGSDEAIISLSHRSVGVDNPILGGKCGLEV
jgi:hypothetical protein